MDKKQVEQIANLARLELTADEAEKYATQLGKILEHFQELNQLNTDNVEPLRTASVIEYNLREDVVEPGLGGEKSTSNGPSKSGYLFKVPPVV